MGHSVYVYTYRGKIPIMRVLPSSFWVNARNLQAEFKKIVSHFEGNLITFKIILHKI